METLQILPQNLFSPMFHMNTISANFGAKIRFNPTKFRAYSAFTLDLKDTHEHDLVHVGSCRKRASFRVRAKVADAQIKENWLASLCYPLPEKVECSGIDLPTITDSGLEWVIGIDPDASGALAILKTDDSVCSAEVFDSPHLQVLVGRTVRKRLDAKSVVELLRSFDAPLGTTAYIEQSMPFPKDGKQGWWSGGFGYGLWIGILVASGFSVVPVPSMLWKNHFELSGSRLSKDDSRKAASMLFPSLSSQLTRKKDHGRAEALLIAAYGKGLKIKADLAIT